MQSKAVVRPGQTGWYRNCSHLRATLGLTVGRFAIAPAFSKASEATWIEIGPLSAIPKNQLARKNILVSQEAGWGRFNAPRLLWVIRKGESVTIFSGVCSHLGCSVNTKEEAFTCACHGSDGAGAETYKKKGVKDFTDAKWQKSRSDAQFTAAINNGKGEVMPAWKAKLSAEEIKALVGLVRAFKK